MQNLVASKELSLDTIKKLYLSINTDSPQSASQRMQKRSLLFLKGRRNLVTENG